MYNYDIHQHNIPDVCIATYRRVLQKVVEVCISCNSDAVKRSNTHFENYLTCGNN